MRLWVSLRSSIYSLPLNVSGDWLQGLLFTDMIHRQNRIFFIILSLIRLKTQNQQTQQETHAYVRHCQARASQATSDGRRTEKELTGGGACVWNHSGRAATA